MGVIAAKGMLPIVVVPLACGAHGDPTKPWWDEPRAGDDPASCIDPAVEARAARHKEILQLVDNRLSHLGACVPRSALSEGKEVSVLLGFDADSGQTSTQRIQTSLEACEIAECLAKGLTSITPEAVLAEGPEFQHVRILLTPGALPRIAEWKSPPETFRDCTPHQRRFGRLEPELIQRIVSSRYAQFRHCYEEGLGHNAALQGRIECRFVINEDGSVGAVEVQNNTIPDCTVATCVRDGYKGLRFPKPPGGKVTVVYPIIFQRPGDLGLREK